MILRRRGRSDAIWRLLRRGGRHSAAAREGVPVIRRADAHPDAPPRRPLTAADLGPPEPPPPKPPVERSVPVDLNTPLSAMDADAVPSRPRAPTRMLPPLAVGERLRTFELAPPPASAKVVSELMSLVARLERGAHRRGSV